MNCGKVKKIKLFIIKNVYLFFLEFKNCLLVGYGEMLYIY